MKIQISISTIVIAAAILVSSNPALAQSERHRHSEKTYKKKYYKGKNEDRYQPTERHSTNEEVQDVQPRATEKENIDRAENPMERGTRKRSDFRDKRESDEQARANVRAAENSKDADEEDEDPEVKPPSRTVKATDKARNEAAHEEPSAPPDSRAARKEWRKNARREKWNNK